MGTLGVMFVSYYEGLSCPVCAKAFTADEDIVVCPQCGLPHHRACWKSVGQCYAHDKVTDVFQCRGIEYYVVPFDLCFPCYSIDYGYDNSLTDKTTSVEKQCNAQYDANPMYGIYAVGLNAYSTQ